MMNLIINPRANEARIKCRVKLFWNSKDEIPRAPQKCNYHPHERAHGQRYNYVGRIRIDQNCRCICSYSYEFGMSQVGSLRTDRVSVNPTDIRA